MMVITPATRQVAVAMLLAAIVGPPGSSDTRRVAGATGATFLDSSVVAVLVETRKQAWDAGVRFAIVLGDDAAEPVRRMFQITRLDSILPVVNDREHALH